jgi:hypothetical protein
MTEIDGGQNTTSEGTKDTVKTSGWGALTAARAKLRDPSAATAGLTGEGYSRNDLNLFILK